MRKMHHHLRLLQRIKRSRSHPLLHRIHKKYHISKRTLFYIKEYGPRSHALSTIIRESLMILLFTSLVSSLGGLALESIKELFILLLPLVILLPVLNDVIGDYGILFSSKISTMLHEGKVGKRPFKNKEIRKLFLQVLFISMCSVVVSTSAAFILAGVSGYALTLSIMSKIFFITLIDVVCLVTILFVVSVLAGIYLFKRKEDPSNLLIPITTSIADFGNMIVLYLLVRAFF